MAESETGWTQQERDNLACTIAESDVTDGLLRNEDIDALVDLFEAWTERRKSPSDAEQLIELRRESLKGICVYCGEIQQYESLEQKSGEEGNRIRVEHIKQCPQRPELKLIAYCEELRRAAQSLLDVIDNADYGLDVYSLAPNLRTAAKKLAAALNPSPAGKETG